MNFKSCRSRSSNLWLRSLVTNQIMGIWLSTISPHLYVWTTKQTQLSIAQLKMKTNSVRLCFDQGFGEENWNRNGKVSWSNGPEQLDRLSFPFLFLHQILDQNTSLNGKTEVSEVEKSWHMPSENKKSVLKICTLYEKNDLPATPPLSLPLWL